MKDKGVIMMHQSKKEALLKQWNQQPSFDTNDKLEKEIILDHEEFSREIGMTIKSLLANKQQR